MFHRKRDGSDSFTALNKEVFTSVPPSLPEVFHRMRDGSDSFIAQEKTVHSAPIQDFIKKIIVITIDMELSKFSKPESYCSLLFIFCLEGKEITPSEVAPW